MALTTSKTSNRKPRAATNPRLTARALNEPGNGSSRGLRLPDCVQRRLHFSEYARGREDERHEADKGRNSPRRLFGCARNRCLYQLRGLVAHQAAELSSDRALRRVLTESQS